MKSPAAQGGQDFSRRKKSCLAGSYCFFPLVGASGMQVEPGAVQQAAPGVQHELSSFFAAAQAARAAMEVMRRRVFRVVMVFGSLTGFDGACPSPHGTIKGGCR